jgi:hypothetical protein
MPASEPTAIQRFFRWFIDLSTVSDEGFYDSRQVGVIFVFGSGAPACALVRRSLRTRQPLLGKLQIGLCGHPFLYYLAIADSALK